MSTARRFAVGLMFVSLVLVLTMTQCLCQFAADQFTPVFTAANSNTVICEPVHTHDIAQPELAEESSYSFRTYTDHEHPTEYAAFLTGWPVTGGYVSGNITSLGSGGEAYWGFGSYESTAWRVEIEWDFAPLPAGSTITASQLHTRTEGHGGVTYWPYGAMLDTVDIPGDDEGDLIEHTIDAGTGWSGGSTVWLDFDCDILVSGDLALAPGIERALNFILYLGWGAYADDDYTHLHISYLNPVTVSSFTPATIEQGVWTPFVLTGSGFDSTTVLTVSTGFEISSYSVQNATTIDALVRRT